MLTKKQSSVSSKSVKFETNPQNYPSTIKESPASTHRVLMQMNSNNSSNYLEPNSLELSTSSYSRGGGGGGGAGQSSFSASLNDSDYFQRLQYIQSLNQQAMKQTGNSHQQGAGASPIMTTTNSADAYNSYSTETRLNQPVHLDNVVTQQQQQHSKKKPLVSARSQMVHHQHNQLNQYQPQLSLNGRSSTHHIVHRQNNFEINEEKVTVL